jgi:hypothetical protein
MSIFKKLHLNRWPLIGLLVLAANANAQSPLPELRACPLTDPQAAAIAGKLVAALKESGVTVLQYAYSKRSSMFPKWDQACCLRTDLGILDVVFVPGIPPRQPPQIGPSSSKGGMTTSHVISPDGQDVQLEGLASFDFVGANMFVSTQDQRLAQIVRRAMALP